MYSGIIENQIKKLKWDISEKTLVIYKGFPPLFIKSIVQEFHSWNMIKDLFNDDLMIIPEMVDSEINELLSKLLGFKEEILVLPYEICLPVSQAIDLGILKRKIVVYTNTLFQQYPKTVDINLTDIESELKLSDDEGQRLFNLFYANSVSRSSLYLVEYPDLPDKLSNIIEVKKFVDDFEYKQLSISDYKGAESNEGVRVVFRSSDSSYDQLRNEIFWGKFDTDLILILDGKPDTFDDVKKDEVATLFHLFEHSTHTLRIEIDEVDEDLSFRDDFSVILRNHWGSNSFRDINFYKNPAIGNRVHNVSQGAVIEEIVTQSEYAHKGDVFKDLFLTAPTGAGKSVLFQIPAIFLAEKYNAVTIVVSPLKALMKDQIEGLKSRGIFNAAFINSDISLVERNTIIDEINEGKISILYLSPELLLSYHLEHFIGKRKLGLLVVDEAHLVTTWGRDFRVDYWFLGNYIKKLRKYHSSKFPVLAVTATAVYGGPDDLVFETVESLNMQMRRLFIGNIRREDISFEVNQIEYESSYEIERKQKTIDQIVQFIQDGTKAIVYFPWTSQIREIQLSLPEEHRDKVRMYYGNVSKEERAEVLEGFRDGDLKVVLATKAFGMGVDISDIEVVYHHAPSGNLSDYVQEIGRVARKSEIDGLAKVDFSSKDLKYTKILYGLSAIRQWHVYGVLEKLFRVFRLKKKRNFLVSVEDFKHIFSDQMTDDAIEQKVKSSLLLIERDLIAKYQYNVIIVRPKSLFSTVYVLVKKDSKSEFESNYGKYADEVELDRREKTVLMRGAEVKRKDTRTIYSFKLDQLWEDHFSDESFPKIKRDFFEQDLFGELNEGVFPQFRIKISLNQSPKETIGLMKEYFRALEQAFLDLGSSFFTKRELSSALKVMIPDKSLRDRFADLLTAIFSSGRALRGRNAIKDDLCFLQKKREGHELKYRIFSNQYSNIRERIERQFTKMFFMDNEREYENYITIDPIKSKIYHNIAYLIESFDLGTFEFDGGRNPQLFIRINDPNKIEYLLNNEYSNTIIKDIQVRHESSMNIMEHFFLNDLNTKERWEFIENYFLGYNMISEEEDSGN